MLKMQLQDNKYFKNKFLKPALQLGLIEMTQSGSPNSPTQKYRLTEKGKEIKL
jgi:ATP-dependent DNA helicase RecG